MKWGEAYLTQEADDKMTGEGQVEVAFYFDIKKKAGHDPCAGSPVLLSEFVRQSFGSDVRPTQLDVSFTRPSCYNESGGKIGSTIGG